MAQGKQKHVFTIVVAALIVIVLVLYMFCFTVRQTEVAVMTLFGRPVKAVKEPGLYFKLPWPIHNVYRFDARVHVFEGVFDQTLTRDKKPLIFNIAVGWRIDPDQAILFLQKTNDVASCEELLRSLVRDAKTKIVGQYDFRSFASIRPGELKHGQIEKEIMDLANQSAASFKGEEDEQAGLGIQVELVKLKRIELPQEVANKVFERMKDERNVEAEAYRSEGRAISREIRARADHAYKAILNRARGDADSIKGKGEAEAAEHYKALHNDPKLTAFLLQVDALPLVANKLTLILDPTVPPFNLLLEPSGVGIAEMKEKK